MSLSHLILLTGPFWIVLWGGWACLTGFAGLNFSFHSQVRPIGLSLLLVLVNLGVGMVVFLRVVHLVWSS